VVDSVDLVADVNLGQDKYRQNVGRKPRGGDVKWGAKGNRIVVANNSKKHKEA